MASYGVGIAHAAAATVAPYCLLRATRNIRVTECGVTNTTAVATELILVRSLTLGTQTATVVGQAGDAADVAATGTLDTTWSTAPTVTAALALKRIQLPATIGAGIIWTWAPGELVLPAGAGATSGLVLWNIAGGSGAAIDVYWKWEE